jgi:hypothetical protein
MRHFHSSAAHTLRLAKLRRFSLFAEQLRSAPRNPSIIGAGVVGIYGLWEKGTLVYVGMSASADFNCAYRIARHRRKVINHSTANAVLDLKDKTPDEIKLIEQSLIRNLDPRYNKHYREPRQI